MRGTHPTFTLILIIINYYANYFVSDSDKHVKLVQKMELKKPIHLLYAPTIFCNMSCQYCYLGHLTEEKIDNEKVINTLNVTLEKLLDYGYLPFNLSFHGGEVTTLPSHTLEALFTIAKTHYAHYTEQINQLGFKVNPLHIKTNLLNFQKHEEICKKYQVSISGSVDLPLQLHEKYRRDKNGNSTLDRIVANLKRLAQYPYNKKISCVVTREHLSVVEAFIADIKFLHYDMGLDMSRFNVMFGFDSDKNNEKFVQKIPGTEMLSDDEQVVFYQKIKAAFMGTSLENAFKTEWFKEFTPEFCCSATNCGNKFFLLQSNGDVYSCPRGQSSPHYRYGNVFEDEIETIIANGWKVIERNENLLELDEECLQCAYISYCHAGCTFVRESASLSKSYTCKLQKVLYQDNPEKYQPLPETQHRDYIKKFLLHNNIKKLKENYPVKQFYITRELFDDENMLSALIAKDKILSLLYSQDLFFLKVNGTTYFLKSAILKTESDIELLDNQSEIILGVRKDIFSIACPYEVNNYIHIMLLRDTTVVYGDENRKKQEHIFDYSLYKNALIAQSQLSNGYYTLDISAIIKLHANLYWQEIRNNLFFTTKSLREYHYEKHKKNAFYHIQAINLPFQNLEFIWNEK